MTELLSTDQRRNAFKRLLKILSNRRLTKQQAVKKLTKPVKVKNLEGGMVEKDPVYSDSASAADFVKELVDSSQIPIKGRESFVVRTDLEKTGGQLC